MKEIELVGGSELTVLVTGETGVGKELVAQALHAASPRADRPMVSLNCAALPDALVESELFGHVRGAFTGAVGERRGKFELADGGTLFLDEVGELPLPAQAKMLRVLQSGQLQRVGSDREHRVDVRLIAATNRDLAAEVRAGRLRADFYHRLSVYPLHVPPLRERGRDVLQLSGSFLEEMRSRLGLGGLRLDGDAQAALLAYDWPGNVRELEHLIGRSCLKALGRQQPRPRILTLTAGDLDLAPAGEVPVPAAAREAPAAAAGEVLGKGLRQAVEDYERTLVGECLTRHRQSLAGAARELQVDRANLARLARRLGVHPGE
jgi:anaerobic nitric oxide reductase transcription regulator